MEAWMAELAALLLVFACIAQGAYQGLILKIYSLVRVVLLIVGTAIVTPVLLVVFPKSVGGREVIAFIAAIILVGIILGVIANALKIVDHIPVVNKLNKLGGAIVGALLGIVLLWLLMLLIELCQDVSWCFEAKQAVLDSSLLGQMYQFNPLLRIILEYIR